MRMRPLLATLSTIALVACGTGDGDERLGQPEPTASASPYSLTDVYAVSNTVPVEDAVGRARTDEGMDNCLAAKGVSSRREDGTPARYIVSLTAAAAATGSFEACISSVKGAGFTPYAKDDGGLQSGQQVALHHCGVVNVDYEGQEWEVENDPFDATNAPDTFSGFGTFSRTDHTLTFIDREGARLTFTPYDGTPDPYNCA